MSDDWRAEGAEEEERGISLGWASRVAVLVAMPILTWQACGIRSELELARAQEQLLTRAHVGSKGIVHQALAPGEVTIAMNFRVRGATPAHDVSATTRLCLSSDADCLIPIVPTDKSTAATIGPESDFSSTMIMELSEEAVQDVKEGRQQLYSYGRVDYRDIYGDWHSYRYCKVYDPENEVLDRGRMAFVYCDFHNCETSVDAEGCPGALGLPEKQSSEGPS
ncbi:MAG: hypothetical protein AAF533_23085 [Acidobacteriota bacterium]